jgi:CMP-N-acetylneuraminic acid synthetase
MIAGLLVGKDKSLGCPGKHTKIILGRPLVEYPLIAASHCGRIDQMFISTDSPFIKDIGTRYGGIFLERPKHLAQPDTLLEDALAYAYQQMLGHIGNSIDIVVLLFANSPMIDPILITQGIVALEEHPDYDTAFSVSKFNMFSPARAHKVDNDSTIQPFVELKSLGNMTSIRDSQGDCYFCDLQVQVMRSRCFTEMDNGQLPYRWMGKKSYAIMGDYGFDIDYEWQIAAAEQWLKSHGFTDQTIPWGA